MNHLELIRLGVFIGLACDADYQRLSGGHKADTASSRLTIAQALEVLQ